MKVRMWTKRAIPVVALVALVSQSAISYAGMGTKNQTSTSTSTTVDLATVSDSLILDESVIVDQGRGYGTAVLNAFDAGATRMTLNATGIGCNNSSAGGTGPVIEFDGTLSSANKTAKLRAQTSAKVGAGQTADYWNGAADLTVALNMANRTFPKQGVYSDGLGNTGVGGNPHIYVRFKNAQGGFDGANDGWTYVGRCVQGATNTVDLLLNLPGRRHIRAASSACTNGASDMSLRMRGGPRLRGEVAFTNQRVANPTDSIHYNTNGSFNSASLAITLRTGALVESWSGTRWQGGNPNFGVSFETSVPNPNYAGPDSGTEEFLYTPTILLGRCKALVGTLPSADLEIGVDQI